MKVTNKIYKVNSKYILADNSTKAINKLRKTGTYRKIECELVCNTKDIIPTTEYDGMILFEVTDNEIVEFITAVDATTAMAKFWDRNKSITSFSKVVTFINEIIK